MGIPFGASRIGLEVRGAKLSPIRGLRRGSFFQPHRHHAPFKRYKQKCKWTPIIVRRVTVRKCDCLLRTPYPIHSFGSDGLKFGLSVFGYCGLGRVACKFVVARLGSFLSGTDASIRANLHLSEVQLSIEDS